MSTIELLKTRRSVTAKDLGAPGPNDEQLQTILEIAHRVPDHRKLGPWRFVVFQGEGRKNFGERLAETYLKDNPDAIDSVIEAQKNTLTRAPLVIAVISNPDHKHKTPVWEQQLAVGAVCQNMLLAASALGFGAQWITEWYSFHEDTKKYLAMSETEEIAGFIYIGSFENKPKERMRPNLEERVTYWEK